MIRDAVLEDIPDILIMGQKFFSVSGYADLAAWDAHSAMATVERLIADDNGILLVIENETVCGMVGAVLYPLYLNANHLTGQEMFFWVDPEARGRDSFELLDVLEDTARKRGAKSFTMINIEGLKSDALARLYRRRGYKPAENTFMKVL